jgi:DMSO reductase anchor subunit
MKPAFSVIFFTVCSGAGLGLLALLILADLFAAPVSRRLLLAGGALALALVTAGLVSSTLHLANPKQAWRAFSRFKRSWLSREGVFAIALYPFALGYLAAVFFQWSASMRFALGVLTLALAWTVLFCTAMIYACLKTIRQWHTPLVPLNYLLLGHLSGALLLAALARSEGLRVFAWLPLALLCVAALGKVAYYIKFSSPDKGRFTLGQAIGAPYGGVTAAGAKLFDVGHSHGTFLTDEFGFRIARERATLLRWTFFAVSFVVPLVILLAAPQFTAFAALACFAGLLVERWLFFAEAQHVVRLYHGQQRA